MLLKSWSLQYLQHLLHIRGVMVLVKGEASSSALDHVNFEDAVLDVGISNTPE